MSKKLTAKVRKTTVKFQGKNLSFVDLFDEAGEKVITLKQGMNLRIGDDKRWWTYRVEVQDGTAVIIRQFRGKDDNSRNVRLGDGDSVTWPETYDEAKKVMRVRIA